jgi:hypothetical protein
MPTSFHRAGFEEAILDSADDYEPYGFVEPGLIPVAADESAARQAARAERDRRVIEASLVELFHEPGC